MPRKKSPIIIHTDGSCAGNPGPGGWAATIFCNGRCYFISDSADNTTNNRMELYAVIAALESLTHKSDVVVYSDSMYVVNGMESKKLEAAVQASQSSNRIPLIKNLDLWIKLFNLKRKHKVKAIWLKGHAGNTHNEIADKLAVNARIFRQMAAAEA